MVPGRDPHHPIPMKKLPAALTSASRSTKPAPPHRHMIWAALLILGVVDLVWCESAGVSFLHLGPVLLSVVLMILLCWLYSTSRRSERLANMAHYAGLWIAFTVTGAIFTYLAATVRLPLRDA